MLRDLLLRYRRTILLSLALLVPLASMYFHGKQREGSTIFERAMLAITAPGQVATDSAQRWVINAVNGYLLLTGVKERNVALERENRILLGEALKSRMLREELRRVKELCEFKASRKEMSAVPARVIGREISQFFRVLRVRLQVGHGQTIREGQAVLSHDGVVGRIEKVSGDYADVMLVTDARSQVHATVAGKGVVGTVRGKGKRKEFGVEFVYLERADRRAPLALGDAVLTTGHDRVFPPGLEIGHISAERSTRTGPYHEFTLTPAVAFATLEEVLVVTRHRTPVGDLPRPKAGEDRRLRLDPANQPDG